MKQEKKYIVYFYPVARWKTSCISFDCYLCPLKDCRTYSGDNSRRVVVGLSELIHVIDAHERGKITLSRIIPAGGSGV